MDTFGRTIHYLRISVTNRCKKRCLVCRPEAYSGWAARGEHLIADKILRVVEIAAGLGFRKFRLTRVEPLARPDIVKIGRRIWEVPGVETFGLSTPGLRLAALAAGFERVKLIVPAQHERTGHGIESDLKPALRAGISSVREWMARPLLGRTEKHAFARSLDRQRPMTAVGG